jgi:hypothetical protein
VITPTDRCIPPTIIDHNPGDIIQYCCTDGMCRGLILKWVYQRTIRCISAIRAGIDTRTARWTPTRRARGRDEWGDTTPPPHDGQLHSTLSEELEDGATIGPVASPPSMYTQLASPARPYLASTAPRYATLSPDRAPPRVGVAPPFRSVTPRAPRPEPSRSSRAPRP